MDCHWEKSSPWNSYCCSIARRDCNDLHAAVHGHHDPTSCAEPMFFHSQFQPQSPRVFATAIGMLKDVASCMIWLPQKLCVTTGMHVNAAWRHKSGAISVLQPRASSALIFTSGRRPGK
ncbi:unnamed protein product [Prorocentrum cordatum]|uniref:Uncharacterized protein n=1 Tax=Prorocentrum cordatum TaxID=2364126 RepID=A0ABN9VQB2_9DINO|nr:unnamed protein product [Polarella glacialis]